MNICDIPQGAIAAVQSRSTSCSVKLGSLLNNIPTTLPDTQDSACRQGNMTYRAYAPCSTDRRGRDAEALEVSALDSLLAIEDVKLGVRHLGALAVALLVVGVIILLAV